MVSLKYFFIYISEMSFHIRRSLIFYLFFMVNCTIFFSVNTDVRPFLLDTSVNCLLGLANCLHILLLKYIIFLFYLSTSSV